MASILGKIGWLSREHVGEDLLLSLLDGELPIARARRVQKHLERCWTCRARRDELEAAIGRFVAYRRQIIAPYMPPPPRGREKFLAKLNELIAADQQPWWTQPAKILRRYVSNIMSPIIATALVVGAAAVLLIFIWQRNLPRVSAHEFLERAHIWDTEPAPAIRDGVIYQKVEIRTKRRKLERTLYRDIAGKRKSRRAVLDKSGEAIKGRIESLGVDWEAPLSVGDFENWRNRQRIFSDQVTRSGDLLLTLTTSVPSGLVASESLTVRASDFHPLERTVEMRDDDRIEIAELNYAVLGWNEVNESLFEPLSRGASSVAAVIHLPQLPSAEQLDLAELQARLVLNRIGADSTEQLEFSRSRTSVQVNGIVESAARKSEIVAQLQRVSHVIPAIFDIDELNGKRSAGSAISDVKVYSIVGRPSPLEQFFRVQEKDQKTVDQLSQQLLDAAASINQESTAVHDLFERFASNPNLGEQGSAILNQLLASHSAKLTAALSREDDLIQSNLLSFAQSRDVVAPVGASSYKELNASGQHNMALCRELISSGDGTPQRLAESVASDLLTSTQQIRTILRHRFNSRTPSPVSQPN